MGWRCSRPIVDGRSDSPLALSHPLRVLFHGELGGLGCKAGVSRRESKIDKSGNLFHTVNGKINYKIIRNGIVEFLYVVSDLD